MLPLLRPLILLLTSFCSLYAAPKVVLLNDTSAWYHWGCTGTSTALKERIQKLGFELEAVPITATYGLKEVPPFEEFNSREHFERFCAANETLLTQLRSSDAVVITGEGTIHDLRAGPRALFYLAHLSKTFLHKHVEIINHSAYPKDDPLLTLDFLKNFQVETEKAEQELAQAQKIYKTIYSELDFVAIREPHSQEVMSQIGVSSTLSFDCLPLYIQDHYHNPKQPAPKTLVLAGSVAFTAPGAEQLCRYLEELESQGYTIKVLTGAAAFPARDDDAFVQFLRSHTTVPFDLIVASSLEQWLDTLNNATLVVSGRFHHSIAAFCLNTPFIALNSNTPKVHAICATLNLPPPLHFSDPDLLTHLLSRTDAITQAPAPDHHAQIQQLCTLAEQNLSGLSTLLKEPFK